MSQGFTKGDFLVFQIESGYGLLRLLGIGDDAADLIWHLRAYSELFPDIDSAEAALAEPRNLTVSIDHVALTNRAFEATQTSRLGHAELSTDDETAVGNWDRSGAPVTDRSIRLMLGLR